MRILRTVKDLRLWRAAQPNLGMVPTMGALHRGHLDLITDSLKTNHSTLISIFVNPSQFAPHEDLDKYPRTFDEDVAKFRETAQAVLSSKLDLSRLAVFAPTVSEMYPSGIDLRVNHQKGAFVEVLGCSHQLEGQVRPQFFRGVSTVVAKLLNAAQPTRAYFGQKDIQQTVVVRNMVRDLLMPTEIIVCPTAREANGLAMSSRNVYLSNEEKDRASVLYRGLTNASNEAKRREISREEVCDLVKNTLATESDIIDSIEYVSLNDSDTFEDLQSAKKGAVISAAIRMKNGVRLIDNVII